MAGVVHFSSYGRKQDNQKTKSALMVCTYENGRLTDRWVRTGNPSTQTWIDEIKLLHEWFKTPRSGEIFSKNEALIKVLRSEWKAKLVSDEVQAIKSLAKNVVFTVANDQMPGITRTASDLRTYFYEMRSQNTRMPIENGKARSVGLDPSRQLCPCCGQNLPAGQS